MKKLYFIRSYEEVNCEPHLLDLVQPAKEFAVKDAFFLVVAIRVSFSQVYFIESFDHRMKIFNFWMEHADPQLVACTIGHRFSFLQLCLFRTLFYVLVGNWFEYEVSSSGFPNEGIVGETDTSVRVSSVILLWPSLP